MRLFPLKEKRIGLFGLGEFGLDEINACSKCEHTPADSKNRGAAPTDLRYNGYVSEALALIHIKKQ